MSASTIGNDHGGNNHTYGTHLQDSRGPEGPLSVLLVEDNPGDARLFEEYLEEGPVEASLYHEETLQDCLEALREEAPDVVVADLGLPDSERGETVPTLTAAAPEVPIVVLTGQEDLQAALQAQEAGATEYLQKENLTPALVGRTLQWALQQSRMQAKLRQRDAWIRSITEGLSAGVFRAGPTGRIEYANEALAEMLGFEQAEQLVGQDLTTFYADPADRGRMLAEEGASDVEVEFEGQGGSTFVGLLSATVAYDAKGKPVHYDGTVTDITERVRRKERLRMLSEAVEQAKEAILVTEADPLEEPGPRIEYVNAACEEMTGYSKEEMVGKTPRVLQGPETERAVLGSLREALEAGEEWEGETINYRKDRTPYRVRWNLAPVRGEKGEIEHWVSVQRDVTEERERQERLRRQKALLEQTQKLAGAWEVDLKNETTSWSDKVYEIHEVEPGTEIGIDESIGFYAPEAQPRIREAFERCVEEGEPYDLELPIITAEGNRRWVRTVGAPMEEKDGEIVKVAGAFQDISERKEKERLLERQNDLFLKAQDLASVGAWEYDILSDKAVWTEEIYQIHGLLPDAEASPEFSTQFYHEEDRPVIEEAFAQAVEDGESYDLELRLITAEGDERWVRTQGEPQTEDGEVVRIRGTIQDITERKRREQTLRRQRNLLDQAQRLAGAWEVDLPSGELMWSEKIYEIHEVEPGTDVEIEDGIEFYAPEARPKIREAFERCVEEGEPYDLELPIITAEGNRRWVRTVGAPVEEENGEIIKVAGAFQDITDQKWAQARLRLQSHILQQVAEGASLQAILADLVRGIEEQRPGMIGSVQLYDPEERRILHGAAPNLPDAYNEAIDGEEIGPSAGSCGTAMHTRSTVIAEDIAEDPRWVDYRDLALSHDLRACWSTPILSSEDEVLGSFAMYYREPQRPSEADEELVELAESLARIAIERHRQEQAIREERDRFATLFHNLPTPVVHGRVGEDGAILVRSVNDAFERVFGVEASAIEGRDIDEYVVPEDRQEEAAEINRRILEEGYQAEVQRKTTDGMRVFRLQVASRTVEEGPSDVYAIYTDVTEERRRYRRQQRQQEALLELTNDETVMAGEFDAAIQRITERAAEVLDVARVNVWLFEEEGRLRCKDHYEQSSGVHYSDMELVPREYPSYVEALAEHRVIEASDAGSDPRTSELEEDYLQPHGIGALLDATLRSEGEIIGVVCHEHVGGPREWATDEVQFAGEVADIVHRALHNREQAERRQELAFQRSLLKAQQEAALDGMLVVDEEQTIVSYNDRFVELWEVPEEFPNQGDDAVVLDWATDQVSDPEAFRKKVEYLYDHPKERSRDEIDLADGRVFDRYTTPLEGEDGTHYGRLWTFRDVTEQKQRERELREAKEEAEKAARLKSAMLANMSHEIRTPLTSITGFSEVLKDELEGQPAEFIRRIHKSGRRLMKTLDSVLQLAKLEAGVYEMEREEVSLRDVIDETTEMLRPVAERKSIVLKVDLPEAPLEGTWNEGALNRIVENLLDNAIKYTPEGGRITVRGWSEQETAVLEVEDTGVGIGEEALPDIFQAFKQESEGLAREYEGTGLGLSIVKRLTVELGGTIDVETEKGEGTCFTVRLPQAGDVEGTSEEA